MWNTLQHPFYGAHGPSYVGRQTSLRTPIIGCEDIRGNLEKERFFVRDRPVSGAEVPGTKILSSCRMRRERCGGTCVCRHNWMKRKEILLLGGSTISVSTGLGLLYISMLGSDFAIVLFPGLRVYGNSLDIYSTLNARDRPMARSG